MTIETHSIISPKFISEGSKESIKAVYSLAKIRKDVLNKMNSFECPEHISLFLVYFENGKEVHEYQNNKIEIIPLTYVKKFETLDRLFISGEDFEEVKNSYKNLFKQIHGKL